MYRNANDQTFNLGLNTNYTFWSLFPHLIKCWSGEMILPAVKHCMMDFFLGQTSSTGCSYQASARTAEWNSGPHKDVWSTFAQSVKIISENHSEKQSKTWKTNIFCGLWFTHLWKKNNWSECGKKEQSDCNFEHEICVSVIYYWVTKQTVMYRALQVQHIAYSTLVYRGVLSKHE